MSGIRVSAKAVIIQDGRLLATKNADPGGFFYLLPGGGQKHGESLSATLERECFEEIGVQVQVGRLLFVRDYIGANHEFAVFDGDVHQVEVMFACSLADDAKPHNGANPDLRQLDVEWLPIDSLHRYRIYPQAIVDVLQAGRFDAGYLGDVN